MKTLIKTSGIVMALGIDGFILYHDFIMTDVHYSHKLGFSGLLGLFVLFVVGWGWVNKKINIKLQSMDTASELGVVGQTPLLLKTTLTYVGLIVPLVLSGLMFFYVGKYFNQVGGSILKVALVTLIPMATNYFGDYVQQNKLNEMKLAEKESLIKGVADEVRKTVGYK